MLSKMKKTILFIWFSVISSLAFSHGGGLNSSGCHNNKSTGDYHCHSGKKSSGKSNKSLHSKAFGEAYYNEMLANHLRGQTEVTLSYNYGQASNTPFHATVQIDILTDEYAIEGGLDKRSSLDSIQQAVFAATLADKMPAVAIYDTDGQWGKYEHRIWQATEKLDIRFIWISQGKVIEK